MCRKERSLTSSPKGKRYTRSSTCRQLSARKALVMDRCSDSAEPTSTEVALAYPSTIHPGASAGLRTKASAASLLHDDCRQPGGSAPSPTIMRKADRRQCGEDGALRVDHAPPPAARITDMASVTMHRQRKQSTSTSTGGCDRRQQRERSTYARGDVADDHTKGGGGGDAVNDTRRGVSGGVASRRSTEEPRRSEEAEEDDERDECDEDESLPPGLPSAAPSRCGDPGGDMCGWAAEDAATSSAPASRRAPGPTYFVFITADADAASRSRPSPQNPIQNTYEEGKRRRTRA